MVKYVVKRGKLYVLPREVSWLLANVNYVNKAPANIVEAERSNLQKEKDKLKIVEKKLNSVI